MVIRKRCFFFAYSFIAFVHNLSSYSGAFQCEKILFYWWDYKFIRLFHLRQSSLIMHPFLIGSSTSFDRFFHPFSRFFHPLWSILPPLYDFCPPFFPSSSPPIPLQHHPLCSISGFSTSVSSSRIDFLSSPSPFPLSWKIEAYVRLRGGWMAGKIK